MNKLLLFLLLVGVTNFTFAQTFTNVAPSVGINETFGSVLNFGGGVSFCDFDNDGDDDLTFSSPDTEDIYFYQNDGGTFTKISPLVSNTDFSKQVLWVDYDNDGDKDLFVTVYNGKNKLYQNDGSQNFTDVTTTAGILGVSDPTYGASFGDYDNDGWLDLYICNYSVSSYTNYMYHSNGDGTFTNTTFSTNTGNGVGFHFVGLFFDYNLDGFQDIYVASDRPLYSNSLFKNDQDGTFTNVGNTTGSNITIDAMNSSTGDYDNDGDFDLYVTNTPGTYSENNIMLRNEYPLDTFINSTAATGTGFDRVGWGANFFDFDNDLDLDLYVSAYHVDPDEPNAIYVNDGTGVFTEPAPNGIAGDSVLSMCNTIGDYNDDGLLDMAVSHADTFKFHLWKNENTNSNNYLKIKLEGTTSNKDGIGAIVELYINGSKYLRTKHCGEGYLGQVSDKIHFGLGTATMADSIIIKWLGGNVDKHYNVSGNQTVSYLEGAAGPLPLELVQFYGKSRDDNSNQLYWETSAEINFNGFEIQRSYNGLTYEKLDFVKAKGSELIEANYNFIDKNIDRPGLKYYRLKMIDNDGTFKYSNVVVINNQSEEIFQVNNIFPNPADDFLNLNYFSKINRTASFKILNSNGMIVHQFEEKIKNGENNLTLNLKKFEQGNYFILIEGNFPTVTSTFSIVK